MKTLCVVLLLLISVAWAATVDFSSRIEKWSEDVVLQDGRKISVERHVGWTTRIVYRDPFFGLPTIPHLADSWPDKFTLKFKHPDTEKIIEWRGEQYYRPVLLDIVIGVPYLVLYGRGTTETEAIYGCPELPYIYLKYEAGSSEKWSSISVENAPKVLQRANLSPNYPDFGEGVLRNMTPDEVQEQMANAERNSAGFFQRNIPITYKDWSYHYKNGHLNERKYGDCRPPRALKQSANLPDATEKIPEILEVIDYAPNRIVVGDSWSNLVFDQKRENECKKLFRASDPDDYMQGQKFVKDSSGKKSAPYSRTTQFNMGVRVLCDEHIWFITHQEQPGKIILSKYTATGDLVFRVSFRNPDRVEGFVGYIRVPSLRSEDGYLYFDWLDFRNINREWHIKRWLRMRIEEPKALGVAVQMASE